jgi:hypothetical protein
VAHLGGNAGTKHALFFTAGDDVGRQRPALDVPFATGSNESSASWRFGLDVH